MNERLLQFIWQHQHFSKHQLQLTSGGIVKIIHPGFLNHHQGPDFTAAKIQLDNTTWVGNIELHVKASEWYKHGHETDPNYAGVILHVVWDADIVVIDQYGHDIPTLVLDGRVKGALLERYEQMMGITTRVPCHHFLPAVNELTWYAWKERIAVERMQRKSLHISSCLAETDNHWDEVFWRQLAMGFGSKTNACFFEQLAKSIPFSILQRHRNALDELEALLFGQAHLLLRKRKDKYPQQLFRTYLHLQRKYHLILPSGQPAFLRMRPASFPTLRLSQLATLLHQHEAIFSKLRDTITTDNLMQLFHVNASQYWTSHYRFDEPTTASVKWLGQQMTIHLLINVAIPMVFTYGLATEQQVYKERALQWLYAIEPEQNRITRYWQSAGIHNRSALDSQSLIELNTQYCVNKRCLECAIGNKLLRL